MYAAREMNRLGYHAASIAGGFESYRIWKRKEKKSTMGKEIFELIAPCHFGMEAVLKREINDLGYEISKVENGKVTFWQTPKESAVEIFSFARRSVFYSKWQNLRRRHLTNYLKPVKAIPWERYIPENGKFWVAKATSVNSKLFSPSDIQRIVKKAMVESLKRTYRVSWFAEDGASYPLRINIMKDIVTVSLDTTGVSLHKRGYRRYTAPAPVTETLAAAMLLLSPWKKDRILVDPFCGSGTIPIEAAMIACRIAPGLNREFLSEEWDNLIPKKEWYGVVEEAQDMVCEDAEVQIQGYDIDDEVLKMARANAALAGVEDKIHFQRRDIINFSSPKKYGFVVSNPPYGERLSDKNRWKCYTAASVRSSKKMIRGHFSC